jgi:hypothetical protein
VAGTDPSNPAPVTVTEVPTAPVVGLAEVEGLTVNGASAELDSSAAVTT